MQPNTTARTALAKTIVTRATLHGDFLLRSGVRSKVYFDKYLLEADPLLLNAITLAMVPLLPASYDALAGLEMGGVPVATLLAQHTGKPTLFVRKQAKEYGTCKLAEGGDVSGRNLVIVEDVVTSGGAILDGVAELRKLGAQITDVVCIIDRESGGLEKLAQAGLTLHALYGRSELEAAGASP
ncbi:MAG: orotate phosphoribosyltransferase [Verrucomicrobia bacterium]|nr:orotate phosphoribosyltransferase [Verrucomicrobiota bacterium]